MLLPQHLPVSAELFAKDEALELPKGLMDLLELIFYRSFALTKGGQANLRSGMLGEDAGAFPVGQKDTILGKNRIFRCQMMSHPGVQFRMQRGQQQEVITADNRPDIQVSTADAFTPA